MNIRFATKVALRYFFAKKNEALVSFIAKFSMIGVTIGCAALVVVMAVMNGFHIELSRGIRGLNSDLTVSSPTMQYIPNSIDVINDIRLLSFVERVNGVVIGQALASSSKNSSGIMIRGIDIKDLRHKRKIIDNILFGDLSNFTGKSNIAIGAELAAILNVRIGDVIKLISPHFVSSAFGSIPRAKDFTIVSIFASGVYDFDSATILMPLDAAKTFLALKEVNMLEVYVNDTEKAIEYSKIMRQSLPHLNVISWQMTHEQFLNALKIERVAMFTILSLIILVAAFNIISCLFMLVKDKTRDIAILKTMGASRIDVMLIFVINGAMIGLIGTIAGIILGVAFASNIDTIKQFLEQVTGVKIFDAAVYFLSNLPAEIIPSDIISIGAMSITLSLIATIYPAYKAATLDPVEAMRYE